MKLPHCIILIALVSSFAHAESFSPMELNPMIDHEKPQIIPPYSMDEFDEVIRGLYAKNPDAPNQDIEMRIKVFSAPFLGQPYIGGSLGEGVDAEFDKSPLYRTDGFDCTTYVATVLALAQSSDLKKFQKNIVKINYRDAEVDYVKRNHFMEVDWNFANQSLGYLLDINYLFVDAAGEPVAKIAQTTIEKPDWYAMKKASTIKTFAPIPPVQVKKMVSGLQGLSQDVQQEKSVMLYVALSDLFDANGVPNEHLFKQIPSGSVIEIVRPDWNLKPSIGTNMNISHMGFAIRDGRGLIFRDASTITNTVRDILLVDYLREYLDHPTIKGIHVLKVLG